MNINDSVNRSRNVEEGMIDIVIRVCRISEKSEGREGA